MILLDTHVLVWADNDDRKLGRNARRRIDKLWADGGVAFSPISFWEVGLLQSRGRLKPSISVRDWRAAMIDAGVVELPLDGTVAVRALDLTGLHEDPADCFIVATALVHDAALMTADERLLNWRHPLERLDARA